jgi:hypothetical protein
MRDETSIYNYLAMKYLRYDTHGDGTNHFLGMNIVKKCRFL